MAYINGSAQYDDLNGTSGDDRIHGKGGDDTLNGGAGSDVLLGGSGDDYLVDGEGDGDDRLDGGAGNDTLLSGAGRDTFDGGDGRDSIRFNHFEATAGVIADLRRGLIINDGHGNRERMTSIESLYANTNRDFVDRLYGDDGANVLAIQYGDVARGFGGDDTISVNGIDGATVDGGEGNDTLSLLDFANGKQQTYNMIVDLRTQMVLDDGFSGSARVRSFENVSTGRGNDQVFGSNGDNVIGTSSGSDRINGRDGDDVIFAGEGDDHIIGGDGNDIITAAEGEDRIIAGNGDDRIAGDAGADRMTGGAGADTYAYHAYIDTFEPFLLFGYGTGRTLNQADVITDFSQSDGDKIDLSPLYETLKGPAFSFLGEQAFTGAEHEIRYMHRGSDTIVFVEADQSRDGFDLVIRLTGTIALTADDFIF